MALVRVPVGVYQTTTPTPPFCMVGSAVKGVVIESKSTPETSHVQIETTPDVVLLMPTASLIPWLRCGACQQVSKTNLSQCAKCWNAFYCSKACQVQDWKRHRHDCSQLHTQLNDFLEQTNGQLVYSQPE